MTAGGDPVIVAIMQQIETVDRTLARLQVPTSVSDDLRQLVLIRAWYAGVRERFEWRRPRALRAFLRVLTTRAVYEWWATTPIVDELHDDDAMVEPAAERLVIARSTLRYLRQNTTPERWRALRSWSQGTPAHEIARREHVPTMTIYTRIRLARRDIAAALARDAASVYIRRR